MQRVSETARLFCTVVALLGAASSVAWAQPRFEYSFHGPWRIEGGAGTPTRHQFHVEVETLDLGSGGNGAQAWSIAIAAEGMRIVSGTTVGTVGADGTDEPVPGLRDDGFEETQVTSGPSNEGLVSAVLLSFEQPVFLPHDGVQRVLSFEVEVDHPAEGEPCRVGRLRFVNGLQGTGQPVENKVVVAGRTVRPELEDFEVLICPDGLFSYRIAGDASSRVAPGRESVTLHPGVFLETAIDGLQGWSLSVESRGDCDLVEATTAGTIGADVATDPTGLRNAGFEKTEVVDPALNGGRRGAVSAIVLSFTLPITVPAGDHRVLALTLDCDTAGSEEGDVYRHSLFFPSNYGIPPESGQLAGAGQPVKTAVTFDGSTVEPGIANSDLVVVAAEPQVAEFVRCDANADGRVDLSDAIWTINQLFRSGPATLCRDAGDCNGDGLVDLSDTVFSVTYLFLRGSEPAAPFPGCGADPSATEVSCPAGSTSCP